MHCKINVLELTERWREENLCSKSVIKVLICVFLGDPCPFHDLQGSWPKALNLNTEKFNGVNSQGGLAVSVRYDFHTCASFLMAL